MQKFFFRFLSFTAFLIVGAMPVYGLTLESGVEYFPSNVGIGISSPNAQLTVEGILSLDEQGSSPSATSGYGKVYVKDDDNIYFLDGSGVETQLNASGAPGGSTGHVQYNDGGSFEGESNFFWNATDNRLGIGTASPSTDLHVSSGTSGDAIITLQADTLDLAEDANPWITFNQDGGNTLVRVGIEGTAGSTYTNSLADAAYFGSTTDHPVQLIQNGARVLTIDATGAIGIGTNTPSFPFEVTGIIATSVGFDGVGAVDLDYGSADITDHTFVTDGTGTTEIVLPAGSIDSTEILDDTIMNADINSSAAIDVSKTALVAGTNISLSTNTLNVDDAFILNTGDVGTGSYDFGGADDFEIPNAASLPGTCTVGELYIDTDATAGQRLYVCEATDTWTAQGDGTSDSDWTEQSSPADYLEAKAGGIATNGATLNGANANTHINLGFGTSVTGASGDTNSYATVGGGLNNTSRDNYATISGGQGNDVTGSHGSVGGGINNEAAGAHSVVGGGSGNYAGDGDGASILGGAGNTASGDYSTVSGGNNNEAGGDYSWAGGRNMQLNDAAHGTFVFGQAVSQTEIAQTNSFLIFPYGTAGTVGIGTATPGGTLHMADSFTSGGTDDFTMQIVSTLNDSGAAGGSDVYRGIKMNITETDVTGWDNVYLMDLQTGGTSQFNITSGGVVTLASGTGVSAILDEDNMASDSATALATQQSIKAYVDSEVAGVSLAMNDISDVTITSIASGEILKWTGSAFINNTLSEAGIAAASHTHATGDITSGTFADARIAESNVTQHEGAIDHGSIAGLGDDDHTQYALLAGRATGQTITGGTASGDDLTLKSTSNATKGTIEIDETQALAFNPFGTSAGETAEIRFEELAASGDNYVGFKAADTLSGDQIWTLPTADGSEDQVLSTNGSGVLSWATPASGDVVGPGSATDNAVARFDTTTGKLIQNSGVTIDDTGLIATPIGLDGVGAVDLDYGSADITDHTFVTDGTGTAEIVLPAGSIDSTEILDDTIVNADINSSAAIDVSKTALVAGTNISLSTNTLNVDDAFILNTGDVGTGSYDFGGADDFEIPNATSLPGTCTVGELYIDTDATAGQRLYVCEATDTWTAQGDGTGGGGTVQGTDGTYDIQATNEGTTSGNARGENSVDLQTDRSVATQVASGANSVIAGGADNTASSIYATVGGGLGNTASSTYATIGGGRDNTADDIYATVGGGQDNTATRDHATVGGGRNNTASIDYATVGGGFTNTASAIYATVGGGNSNTASAQGATVPGGSENTAAGEFSFAAGRNMQLSGIAHKTFVFGHSDSNQSITTSNAFLVFPKGDAGSMGIGTDAPSATLDSVLASTATTAAAQTGNEFNVTDTGVVTTGTDTTIAADVNLTRTGATGGTINTTGMTIDLTTDNGGGGTHTATGLAVTLDGNADTNYAATFSGGNVGIGTTTPGSELEVTGTISTTVGLDGVGAVDLDYGSADITDHTFVTDGTGTAEIVLPAGSIDSTEILDDTIVNADINSSAAIDVSKTALVAGTNISLSTNTLNVDDAFILNTGDVGTGSYDFGGADDFEIPNAASLPGTCTVGELYIDTDATAGQRLYVCEATDTWTAQGDGTGSTSIGDAIGSGTANSVLFIGSDGNLAQDNSNFYWDDTNNDFGIGTNAPASRIHGVDTLSAATGNEIAYQLNYTTNKATSGNDTGLLISMTDTASPGTSLPFDIQVGASSVMRVNEVGNITTTGRVYLPDGTSGAPSLSFTSDTDSGLHREAEDSILLLAGGSYLKVTSDYISPSHRIELSDGGNATTPVINWGRTGADSNTGIFRPSADILGLSTNGVERLRVDDSGNIGIGVTTVTAKLDIDDALSGDPGDVGTSTATEGAVFLTVDGSFDDDTTLESQTAADDVIFTKFARPTLTATNASVTTTEAATVYIENAPAASTNQTLNNPYALWVDAGSSRFDGYIETAGLTVSSGTFQLPTGATVTGILDEDNMASDSDTAIATQQSIKAYVDANAGTGDVVGPGSATDNAVARFDTTTGKLIQNSGVMIDDTGLIATPIGLDGVGAVDLDYGSADITDHTFVTDGTGTAEIVLPAGSIDSTEILDDTIVNADINSSAAIDVSKTALVAGTNISLSTNTLNVDDAFILNTGDVGTGSYDFGGADDFEIPNATSLPGTCAVGEIYVDTDATSGQRLYLCEATDTWAVQGDGTGSDSDWTEQSSPADYLEAKAGGIASNGATLYGTNATTHINLGFGTSVTGTNGQNRSYATISGGQNNDATHDHTTVGGGYNNIASNLYAAVTGGWENTASGEQSFVGGGYDNTASGDYATIGGGDSNISNSTSSTVGGGFDNTASGEYGTVAGGDRNVASGNGASVGGGNNNTASGQASMISGGQDNIASGAHSVVNGGFDNRATAQFATVSGGDSNRTAGDYSWVGGRYMQPSSAADRTFVWGYATSAQSITTPDAFLIFPAGDPGVVGIGIAAPTAQVHTRGALNTALTGTVSVTASQAAVTGSGTAFTTELNVGDSIKIANEIFTVQAITDNTNLTLDSNHSAGASSVTAYRDPTLLAIENGDSVSQLTLDKSGSFSLSSGTGVSAILDEDNMASDSATALATQQSIKAYVDSADTDTQNTLDEAYDEGGAGAGRTITVDSNSVFLDGSDASNPTLLVDNSANGGGVQITNGGTGDSLLVEDQTSDPTPFVIDDGGNVGIGDSEPDAKLDVHGSILSGGDGQDGSLRIYSEEGGTDQTIIFQPPADMTQDTTYTLPPDDGTSGQVLSTDGAGVLTWEDDSTGGITIGDTVTSGTINSVLFVGSDGNLAQDNSNFFWDDTNNRLGIGTATPGSPLEVTGVIATTVGLDGVGAVDLDYGSADITDHTFVTDGTGTAEIVLPAGSIDATEILDGTIANADINASAAIDVSKTALVAGTNISLATNTLNVDDAFILNTGDVGTGSYDFGGADDFEIPNATSLPGTCTVGELYIDTDATAGQRLYVCEATDTWTAQGDGTGGEWTDTGTIVHPSEETVDEIAIGGTTEGGADIFLGADGNAAFNKQGTATGDFQIEGQTDANLFFTDASNNSVGIGTGSIEASFAVKLQIAGDYNQVDTEDDAGQLIISGSTDQDKRVSIGFDTTDDYAFIRSFEKGVNMRPLALQYPDGGPVGVGTNAPGSIGTGGSPQVFQIHDLGTTATTDFADLILSSATTGNNGTIGNIDFASTGLSGADKRTATISSTKRDAATDDPTGDLQFWTANGGAPTEKMTIRADGNVGIGTTSPGSPLEVAGLIATTVGLDGVGAVDLDYGSADITDHTFVTDGTGTAEIVLPAGSIDSTEILDDTLVNADINSSAAIDVSKTALVAGTNISLSTNTLNVDDAFILNTGDVGTGSYDFGGADDFEIPNAASLPGTCTVGELYIDTDATAGQRLYVCEATDTWTAQGDGAGSGGTVQGTDGTYDIQATNEGTTSGNARGENSVDLQTNRSAATQVASGTNSAIGGGANNTASNTGAMVGGGQSNTASNTNTVVAGGLSNTASGAESTVGGGYNSTASGGGSTVGGGDTNTASGGTSTIAGGGQNTASGPWSAVGGGHGNSASNDYAVISGGRSNTATNDYSTVSGGYNNDATANYATVGGGTGNVADGAYSVIPGGASNTSDGDYSFSAGRNMQLSSTADGSFVFGQASTAQALTQANSFLIFPSGDPGVVGIGIAAPTAQVHTRGALNTALTGTVSVTASQAAVTGSGTAFTTELNVGDSIKIEDEIFTVQAITDNTNLTLDSNHSAGASAVTAYSDPDLLEIENGDGVDQLVLDKSGSLTLSSGTGVSAILDEDNMASDSATALATQQSIKAYVDSEVAGAGGITIGDAVGSGTANSVLFIGSDGNLAQDNTNFYWDDTNNRLGIGETSPEQLLHIAGNAAEIVLETTGGDGTFVFQESGTNKWGINYEDSAEKIAFYDYVNTIERFVILQGGDVGIGVTSPTSRIHADDTLSAATGNEIAYQLDYTTNKATSGNDTGLLISMTDTASPGTSLPLDIQVGASTVASVDETGDVTGATFTTTVNGSSSNPAFGFSVGSTGFFNDGGEITYTDGGTDMFVLTSNSLRGKANDGAALLLSSSGSASQPAFSFPSQDNLGMFKAGSDTLGFSTNGAEALRIDASGNVGIGVTTVTAKLDIDDSLSGDPASYGTSTATEGAVFVAVDGSFDDDTTLASQTAADDVIFTKFARPTLTATNASVTTTEAATVYIENAPEASTNQTIDNPYAFWVDAGTTQLDGDANVGGALTVTGLIASSIGFDGVGAVDLDYGSADITDHTFVTDGTGDTEFVVPNDSIGPDELDSTTGAYDFGGVTSFEIPNATSLPGTCVVGELYIDTDATAGQRLYVCEATNTWTAQGDGTGSTSIGDAIGSGTINSVLFIGSDGNLAQDNSNFYWDDTNNFLGIGTASPNSLLHVDGSFAVKRTATATNVSTDDEVIIGVTNTDSARTITLDTDDVIVGRLLIIKDESGGAGTNNITIDTEGSETIDGASSVAIDTNYGVVRLYSDGSNWFSY